jgi:hypothetical protein
MGFRPWATIVITLASTAWITAAVNHPRETNNAALRYWMAFAEMRDVSADKATQALLEKTAAGEAAWDEAKLAPILDANADALGIMQRATQLSECDWGLEYRRGARASMAYAPRARALARLNTLEGMRQMAKGDSQSAVNTWLAGIRFSQDLAHGGTLIFALMAKATLLPNLRMLGETARNGQLNQAEKTHVLASVRALPEDGFDWGAAWELESLTVEQTLEELRSAPDPKASYQAMMGQTAPTQGLPPTMEEIQKYRDYAVAVQSALRRPPEEAKGVIDGLETQRRGLGTVEQNMTPNAQKMNRVRTEATTARAELLALLDVAGQ